MLALVSELLGLSYLNQVLFGLISHGMIKLKVQLYQLSRIVRVCFLQIRITMEVKKLFQ